MGMAQPEGGAAEGHAAWGAARPGGAVDVQAGRRRMGNRVAEGLRGRKLGSELLIPCREVEIGKHRTLYSGGGGGVTFHIYIAEMA